MKLFWDGLQRPTPTSLCRFRSPGPFGPHDPRMERQTLEVRRGRAEAW
jgi:hypothetical protein